MLSGLHSRCGVASFDFQDLTVENAPAMRDFYTEVIGWTVQDVAMKDAGEQYADYAMNGGDGAAAAGVCHARGTNTGIPPVWMLYLPVGDFAESVRRAQDDGGTIVKQIDGGEGGYTFAIIKDPVAGLLIFRCASAGSMTVTIFLHV